jgi:prepilin-type N-terminal cleavage/methylation domain-containing protein
MLNKIIKGFTLIELLVVLAIVSILFSLVGPLAQEQIDRSEAYAEWRKVTLLLDNSSAYAYTHSLALNIELNGSKITVRKLPSLEIQASYNYKYVFFEPQILIINSNGNATPSDILARLRNKSLSYRMHTLADRAVDRLGPNYE